MNLPFFFFWVKYDIYSSMEVCLPPWFSRVEGDRCHDERFYNFKKYIYMESAEETLIT